ncbi:MAG: potassium channel protein, partial [Campylobacterota bacterium]
MNLLQRIRKFLNWETAPKPDTKLLPEVYPHLKAFRLPLILTVVTMMVGSVGYVIIDDFTLMDAIYQTGIT